MQVASWLSSFYSLLYSSSLLCLLVAVHPFFFFFPYSLFDSESHCPLQHARWPAVSSAQYVNDFRDHLDDRRFAAMGLFGDAQTIRNARHGHECYTALGVASERSQSIRVELPFPKYGPAVCSVFGKRRNWETPWRHCGQQSQYRGGRLVLSFGRFYLHLASFWYIFRHCKLGVPKVRIGLRHACAQ